MQTHNRHEASRRTVIRRALLYGALFFLTALLQCSFFPELSFLPAIPNLTLGALVTVSLFDTRETALISAIASGFLLDTLGSSGLSLTPLFFLLIAAVFSGMAKKILPSFITYAVLMLPASFCGALYTLLMLKINGGTAPLGGLITSTLLPELILTLVFSLPLCIPAKLISRFVDAKSKFKL